MADEMQNFPEVFIGIYWEAVHRKMFQLAEHVRQLFIDAREAELEAEVAAMDSWRREVESRRPPPPPSPPQQQAKSPVPPTPKTWAETATLIRNAVVQKKAHELAALQSSYEDWAVHSPLALLGYKTGKSGLSDLHRQHFLHDYVTKAVLPSALPATYLAEWGGINSKLRLQRTVRHIAFQKILRESNDLEKYASAIEDWQLDLDYLRQAFEPTFSEQEWESLLREQ